MSRRVQLEVVAALLAAGALLLFQARVAQTSIRAVAPQPEPASIVHEEQRTVAVALPAALSNVAARAARSRSVEDAVDEARAGHIDPVELSRRLRAAGVADGPALLRALVEEKEPAIALQLAQALGGLLDDPPLRAQTVAALRSAPSREVGLLALLGRGEPDALALAADTLVEGSPEARATAAFVLNNAPVPPPDRALTAARAALADAQSGARLREEAATLLGRSPGDEKLLEGALFQAEPAVRMRALAALDVAGSDLRDDCDRLLRDPEAPPRLVEMAKAWRAMHP